MDIEIFRPPIRTDILYFWNARMMVVVCMSNLLQGNRDHTSEAVTGANQTTVTVLQHGPTSEILPREMLRKVCRCGIFFPSSVGKLVTGIVETMAVGAICEG